MQFKKARNEKRSKSNFREKKTSISTRNGNQLSSIKLNELCAFLVDMSKMMYISLK